MRKFILGILEMINMISRLLGSLYLLLFPLKKPNLGNLMFTILQACCMYFVVLGHYFPTFVKPLMIVGFIGLGIGRASTFLPYLLAYQNLRSNEDVVTINLCFALSTLGCGFPYLIEYLVEVVLHCHWTVELYVAIFLLLISGVVVYAVVDEVPIEDERRNQ